MTLKVLSPASIYRSAKRLAYYLLVLVRYMVSRKVLVGYTKKHPIYTDTFEGNHRKYLFYFDDGKRQVGVLLAYLRRKSSLYHLDAASAMGFLSLVKGPYVIECEGRPRDEFFLNAEIKHVFVESRWAGGDDLTNGRVTLLYPGVNVFERLRRKDKDVLTICAVGYGGMIKGYDVVYRLYKKLREKYKIRLVIAGSFGHNYQFYPEITEDSYERYRFPDIELDLKNDPAVVFRPFKRTSLFNEVYSSADIYLHLSRLETFGFSVLEAMSFSLPVVATGIHAIPEMVVHGMNGFLVDPFDFDINSSQWHDKAFEQALHYVETLISHHDLRRELSINSFKRATEFSIANRMAQLEPVYGRVARA